MVESYDAKGGKYDLKCLAFAVWRFNGFGSKTTPKIETRRKSNAECLKREMGGYMMRNRERLMQLCDYDLLCMMQKNLDDSICVDINVCILDLLGVDTDKWCDGLGECDKCIAAWLNERSE